MTTAPSTSTSWRMTTAPSTSTSWRMTTVPSTTTTGSTTTLAALAATLVLAGCGGEAGRPPASETASPDTVMAVVAATIGAGLDGAEEYLLGRVTSVAADSRGIVYVADDLPPSVRAFGPDGEFVAWIGREGQGPGEFEAPRDILSAQDGRLYVRGIKVTVFEPSAGSSYADSLAWTWPIPPYANLESWRARLADDIYYYPHRVSPQEGPDRYFYLKYDADGLRDDTLHVHEVANMSATRGFAFFRTGPGGGRLVHGVTAPPFAARAAWDVTERGTVLIGDGEAYRLQELAADGSVLREIAGPDRGARPVPAGERADSTAALQVRLDSVPVPLDEVENIAPEILRGDIPETLPPFVSVHLGVGSRIWVERWPPEGMGSIRRYYDVLEDDGRYAGTVVVPAVLLADPPPFFGNDVVVGVIEDPATEVQSVVTVRFALPGGPA